MPSFRSKNHLVRLMLSFCLATVGAVATVAPGAAQFVVVCDALTIDELNDLSSLQYDSASRRLGDCTYAPPSEEGANHSLTVNLAPIGSIKELTE